MTKTRWDEPIAVSIVLSSLSQISNNSAATWAGLFEVRSSVATVDAFQKNLQDSLHLFSGALVQLSNTESSYQPANDSADAFSASISGSSFAAFGSADLSNKAQWSGAGSSSKSASPFDDPIEVRLTAATTDPWAM